MGRHSPLGRRPAAPSAAAGATACRLLPVAPASISAIDDSIIATGERQVRFWTNLPMPTTIAATRTATATVARPITTARSVTDDGRDRRRGEAPKTTPRRDGGPCNFRR